MPPSNQSTESNLADKALLPLSKRGLLLLVILTAVILLGVLPTLVLWFLPQEKLTGPVASEFNELLCPYDTTDQCQTTIGKLSVGWGWNAFAFNMAALSKGPDVWVAANNLKMVKTGTESTLLEARRLKAQFNFSQWLSGRGIALDNMTLQQPVVESTPWLKNLDGYLARLQAMPPAENDWLNTNNINWALNGAVVLGEMHDSPPPPITIDAKGHMTNGDELFEATIKGIGLSLVGHDTPEPVRRSRKKAALLLKHHQLVLTDSVIGFDSQKIESTSDDEAMTVVPRVSINNLKANKLQLAAIKQWVNMLLPLIPNEVLPANNTVLIKQAFVKGQLDGNVTFGKGQAVSGDMMLTDFAVNETTPAVDQPLLVSLPQGQINFIPDLGWQTAQPFELRVINQPATLAGQGNLNTGVGIVEITSPSLDVEVMATRLAQLGLLPPDQDITGAAGKLSGQIKLAYTPEGIQPAGQLYTEQLQMGEELPAVNADISMMSDRLMINADDVPLTNNANNDASYGRNTVSIQASATNWWQSSWHALGLNMAAMTRLQARLNDVSMKTIVDYLPPIEGMSIEKNNVAGLVNGSLVAEDSLNRLLGADIAQTMTGELQLTNATLPLAVEQNRQDVVAKKIALVVNNGSVSAAIEEMDAIGLGLATANVGGRLTAGNEFVLDETNVSFCPLHATRIPLVFDNLRQLANPFINVEQRQGLTQFDQQLQTIALCDGLLSGQVAMATVKGQPTVNAQLAMDGIKGTALVSSNGQTMPFEQVTGSLAAAFNGATNQLVFNARQLSGVVGQQMAVTLDAEGQGTLLENTSVPVAGNVKTNISLSPQPDGSGKRVQIAAELEALSSGGLQLRTLLADFPEMGTIHAQAEVIPAQVMDELATKISSADTTEAGLPKTIHDDIVREMVTTNTVNGKHNDAPLVVSRVWTDSPLRLEPFTRDWLAPLLPDESPLVGDSVLEQDNYGQVAMDITAVNREGLNTLLLGHAEAEEVGLPLLDIANLTGNIQFLGIDSRLAIDSFSAPGVEADTITATIKDTLLYPTHLNNLSLHAGLFDINGWNYWLNDVVEPRWMLGVSEPLIRPLLPPPAAEKITPVPVVFYNGNIKVDEAVYDTVVLDNLTGKLSVHETGFVELTNVDADVADGKVKLTVEADPLNDDFVSAVINAKGVSANALAVALLDAPNQIFGSIDGTIQFATRGSTEAEQMANANGSADFRIEDGRLPAIARIETLLAATNVLRGGVLGLNLNNLLRTLDFTEDNYFASMSGSMKINEGVGYTDDLLSDGKNLDLLMEGNMHLADGYTNMLVYGEMNNELEGGLGWLGRLSLNSVLGKLPGIGFLPFGNTRKGLLAYVPGVGYVPFLGHNGSASTRFKVVLEGYLDDDDVLKSFSWEK